ncbi:MAG: NAD(P)/FAD-dependent oxidoreductase [Actinobacteria bacterium]|nr:NAD(P)/FAD-dependent oxidoreductase [Actinomycetota bacterium]
MDEIYDVIISGGGPSGSLLGFLLSSSNINTLIIEKEIFPRYKTCAGGIAHRTLKILPFNIEKVIEKNIYGIYFSQKNKDICLKRHAEPIIYTVDRKKFDFFIADKAKDSGCNFKFGEKVESYDNTENHVIVKTDKNKYRAKVLAGADGTRGLVHRAVTGKADIKKILCYETEIDLTNIDSDYHCRYPGEYSDKNENIFDFKDNIRLDFNGVRKGYCWVFPKKDYLSCGIGASSWYARKMRNYFQSFLSVFYTTNKNKDGPGNLKINAQHIPVGDYKTPVCDYRILTVGDAACIGDGFTGEGLYNSFRSSFIASDSIVSALKNSIFNFNDYESKIRGTIFRDIKISLIFTKIFFNSLLFFYKLIKNSDNYFSACCKILRGERNYKDVIDKLKIIKY